MRKSTFQKALQEIYATETAFAAIRKDGSVITWGHPEQGGDATAVARNCFRHIVGYVANSW